MVHFPSFLTNYNFRGELVMFFILILAIVFYLYKTGELQALFNKTQVRKENELLEAKRLIDTRYASGQLSTEEYIRLKSILY